MLSFFRKLRRPAAAGKNEMKGTKYLKYAIGEIILVVVGILIAFSLNNWKEDQKTIRQEKALLKKVHEENRYNIQILEENNQVLKGKDQRLAELSSFLSQPRSKKIDQEVESLILDVIDMGLFTYSLEFIERYINNSENEVSVLNSALISLKDNLNSFQKASEMTYNYELEKLWPYFEKGLNLKAYSVVDHKILRDRTFINRLVIVESMATSNYDNLITAYNQSMKIDSLINETLKF